MKFRFRDRIERRQWLQCLEDQTRPIRRTFLPKHVPQFPATPESHQIRSNFTLATKKVHIDSNQQQLGCPPIPSALSMAYLEHSSMSQPETPNSKRRRSAISMVSSAFSKLKTKTASRLKKRVSFG